MSLKLLDPKYLHDLMGPWLMEERSFEQYVHVLERMDFESHVQQQQGEEINQQSGDDVELIGADQNIARIVIRGPMSKRGTSFSDAGSTVRIRRQIRAAVNREDVRGIVLEIDSPGGTAAGTPELAEEIRRATDQKKKQVVAVIEDLGASAAYFAASQAGRIIANAAALVGSIGTYMVVADTSQAAEQAGIKVHVIRAGEFKGAGTPGTEITDAQLSAWQELIEATNDMFVDAVQAGRRFNKKQIRSVANGRIFTAQQALDRGLIDQIGSLEAAVNEMTSFFEEEDKMAKETIAATPKELRSALPGANSDFIVAQLEAGSTLEEARDAWIIQSADYQAQQDQKLQKQSQQLQEMQAEMEELKKKQMHDGVEPLGNEATEESGTNAREEWLSKIDEKVKRGMSRQQAVIAVNKENAGLRLRMLDEYAAA